MDKERVLTGGRWDWEGAGTATSRSDRRDADGVVNSCGRPLRPNERTGRKERIKDAEHGPIHPSHC